jgi:hypothetical protein
MAAFTEMQQALYDMIASTLVMKSHCRQTVVPGFFSGFLLR